MEHCPFCLSRRRIFSRVGSAAALRAVMSCLSVNAILINIYISFYGCCQSIRARRMLTSRVNSGFKKMTNLSFTLGQDFSRFYQRVAEQIRELVEPISTEQLWFRPYPYGNSVGHLLLHLTGNLNHYVGAEMARTGHVRDRPLEFSDRSHPAKELVVKNFLAAIAMVIDTLDKQLETDWTTAF